MAYTQLSLGKAILVLEIFWERDWKHMILPCGKFSRNSRNWFNCSLFVFNCSENDMCVCFYEHMSIFINAVYSHFWDQIDHSEKFEWENHVMISLIVTLLLSLSFLDVRIEDATMTLKSDLLYYCHGSLTQTHKQRNWNPFISLPLNMSQWIRYILLKMALSLWMVEILHKKKRKWN